MGLFGKKKADAAATAGHEVTLNDGSTVKVAQTIDCIGDSCPRPQLMTKAAMGKAKAGDVIEVKVDNSTSMEALPPMMTDLQGTHLQTQRMDRYWQVLLRKD